MNEAELFAALRPLYPKESYALFPQVANGTGARCSRHADAIAMGLWPSRGLTIEGFEIKCSRSDWKRELDDHEKAEAVAQFCDLWWVVVADASIVHDGELPKGWGLIVFVDGALKKSVIAKQLEPIALNRSFVAAVLRQAQNHQPSEEQLRAEYQLGLKAGEVSRGYIEQKNEKLREKVTEFEKASGIEIDSYRFTGEQIGAAVRAVLAGEEDALRTVRHVRAMASDLLAKCDEVIGLPKKKARRTA